MQVIDSEIYISVEDAEFNAEKYGVTFIEEILRLVIHGVLHLLGYDDMAPEAKTKMKRIENRLFEEYDKKLLADQSKIKIDPGNIHVKNRMI